MSAPESHDEYETGTTLPRVKPCPVPMGMSGTQTAQPDVPAECAMDSPSST